MSARPARTGPVRRLSAALAALAALVMLVTVGSVAALADDGLTVVTVSRTSQGVAAVVQLNPAPLAPLARDSASITPDSSTSSGSPASGSSPNPSAASPAAVPATVSPVLDLTTGTPLALVVDAQAPAQTLSGCANVLLKLPSDTPVAVVADASPPILLTPDTARPSDGITALTALSSRVRGSASGTQTAAALDLAAQHLPQTGGRARLVVLATTRPAPTGRAAEQLADRLVEEGVVLSVVEIGGAGNSWGDLAERTGGTAVPDVRGDPSAAYDRVLSTLEGRYVVRFVPPPGVARVRLTVASAGQQLTTEVPVPSVTSTPTPTTAPARSVEARSWLLPVALIAVVLLAAVLVVALVLRRRGSASAEPATAASDAGAAPAPQGAVTTVPEAAPEAAVTSVPAPAATPVSEAAPEAAAPPAPAPAATPVPEAAPPETAAPPAPATAATPVPQAAPAAVPEAAEAVPEPAEAVPEEVPEAAAMPASFRIGTHAVPAASAAAEQGTEASPAGGPAAGGGGGPAAAAPDGVRVFDVSDPGHPTEITNGKARARASSESPPTQEQYVGRHRMPGWTSASADQDDDADADDADADDADDADDDGVDDENADQNAGQPAPDSAQQDRSDHRVREVG